jgi:hypothetical protein
MSRYTHLCARVVIACILHVALITEAPSVLKLKAL